MSEPSLLPQSPRPPRSFTGNTTGMSQMVERPPIFDLTAGFILPDFLYRIPARARNGLVDACCIQFTELVPEFDRAGRRFPE